ncbi:hypothetical protein [Thermomonospora umbrina]|uniref:Uncharacterized protein n=1 Tax=Thermomonospora umbrina TaxID=111806 RepID=A0A3D9T1Q6_9ACTN|nr:hypothetical protein [Thermomonospora umbrina]REE97761.1 hypothetical protein DFJ69_3236 [Thermomonospora umbrina]
MPDWDLFGDPGHDEPEESPAPAPSSHWASLDDEPATSAPAPSGSGSRWASLDDDAPPSGSGAGSRWASLDDDASAGGAAPSGSGSRWSSLDDEPAAPAPAPSGSGSRWASLDDESSVVGEVSPGSSLNGGGRPASELVASQLRVGEVLWAKVAGPRVELGSGQPLNVPGGPPDAIGGWRRVRILDADTMRAEVLPFPAVREPTPGVGEDPEALFPPEPVASPPRRPPGFPLGAGGDLAAAFADRVRRAEEEFRRRAEELAAQRARSAEMAADRRVAAAQAEAGRQVQAVRAEADRRVEAAERTAAARVQQARDTAGRQVAQAGESARQQVMKAEVQMRAHESNRRAAEIARDEALRIRTVLIAVAAVGWLGLVLLALRGLA